ncbi:MAG: tyrosine-protein phosphatase [Anaeroplasmataceae bacterium]|nr:tyrosine-protein phosphatase [Anaeroplasmataceae bacterium]
MESLKINLSNTSNTRSLSTLVNQKGEHIKNNLLIRSDALNHIEENDIFVLSNQYKLKRIIDFRCDNEVLAEPDQLIPNTEYFHYPVLPNERVGITRKGSDEKNFEDFIKTLHENGIQSSINFMSKVYEELVDPFANEGYKKFLHVLLEPVDGATLWHCSAGKDRAGFATILILYILDFDLDTIINDYLDTNHYYQKKIDQYTKLYGKEYYQILKTLFGVNKQYILVLFKKIEEVYGGMDLYITNILDITLEKKEKLRRIYLGE